MHLVTPRLTLREFRATDFDALCAIDCRPESVRYEPQMNADGVSAYLHEAEMQAYVQPRTLFRFAVTRTPDDTVRGLVGLSLNIRMTRDWEIGWSIHPDDWGQGYATEAAQAVIDLAFRELDAHRVIAFCDAENRASERVMQKLGMRHEGSMRQTRLLRGAWRDELLYGVLESEWPAICQRSALK